MDALHAGDGDNVLAELFHVDVTWHPLHEHIKDIPRDVLGGEHDQDGEQKGANRIENDPVRFPPNQSTRNRNPHTLHQVAEHVNGRSSQVHVLALW
eukprot:scaffold2858_cov659-Pavlova_lutheri.AAC.10